MKVAYQLGVAGYIETVRGRGGGLRLAKSPKAIILGEVVRHTEPDMALVPCFKPIDAFCVNSTELRIAGCAAPSAGRIC